MLRSCVTLLSCAGLFAGSFAAPVYAQSQAAQTGASASTAAVTAACPDIINPKYYDYGQLLTRFQKKNGAIARGKSKGMPMGNYQITANEMRDILDRMMRKDNAWDDAEWLGHIDANIGNLTAFEGSEGLLSRMFLRAAQYMLGSNANFTSSMKITLVPRGKIDQFGFNYNPTTRSGYVWNTMCFTMDKDDAAPVNFLYRVQVVVRTCGFAELQYDGSDPNDAFPGSYISFPKSVVDNGSTFDRKLEAVSFRAGAPVGHECYSYRTPEETADSEANGYVRIGSVFLDTDGDGTFDLIPPTSGYYKTTAQSCLDMFFKDAFPTSLNDGSTVNYCLGRCTDPPIINTGL